jgi:hypothetical protein
MIQRRTLICTSLAAAFIPPLKAAAVETPSYLKYLPDYFRMHASTESAGVWTCALESIETGHIRSGAGPTAQAAFFNVLRSDLLWSQPEASPKAYRWGALCGGPPGEGSPTWRWISYRDRSLEACKREPDDPDNPNFVKHAEAVLAWRAELPPGVLFWVDLDPRRPEDRRCLGRP